jgi:hypothetical protein
MFSFLRAALLSTSFAVAASAQAQFKPVEIPTMPAMPTLPAPMPTLPAPSLSPTLTLPNPGAAPTPAPAIATPVPVVAAPAAPAPTALVPGCPGRADCPPEPGAEGALSEAAKEIIKELVKCEVEGKSIDECLSDDPPPPRLAELNEAERSQLKSCLGSNDLAATQDLWSTCVPGLR